jgi:protein-tyrosine phosphatase
VWNAKQLTPLWLVLCGPPDEAKESGAAVLVHCEYGISRSATVVIAWLIKHHGMTLKEAFEHTKAQRRVIMPNEGPHELQCHS